MSQPTFIRVISQSTTGALGALPRSIVVAGREAIAGSIEPNANTGLYKITAALVSTFEEENPTAYGFIKALRTAFGFIGTTEIYLLSTQGVALTSAMLDKANYNSRAWSFLNVASQTNGLDDEATFLADCVTAATWTTAAKRKVFFHSFSVETGEYGETLPAALQLEGALTTKPRTKSLITNAHEAFDEYTDVYHNPLLAALCFCLYGGTIARSLGSLSDAHDFAEVDGDTYSAAFRATIEANSLAQYNGAKDQGGSKFVYDTFLNDDVNPPTTAQLETIIAQDYIDDFVPISVRNALQGAGRTGVEASYKGLLEIYTLTNTALNTLWKGGVIQTKADGTADYTLTLKTLAEIDALNPNWRAEGVIPVGAIVGQIRAYGAIHYANILFNYN